MPDNKLWNRLLERAFGGEDIAAAPGVDIGDIWSSSPAAASADVVCDMMSVAVQTRGPNDAIEWVFLVGSAGNGKSYLANQLTSAIQCEPLEQGVTLARRAYNYQLPNGNFLRVVNDATIPPTDTSTLQGNTHLLNDLTDALDNKKYLFVCINRGILLKERGAISKLTTGVDSSTNNCASEIISLMLGDVENLQLVNTRDSIQSSYYKFATIKLDDHPTYNIHVLFLDQVSLIERAVKHGNNKGDTWHKSGSLIPGQYEVSKFPDKTGDHRECSPANILVSSLVDMLAPPGGANGIPSPLDANLALIKSPSCRHNWLNILRAAEIKSGSLLTYREIWGLAVLGLIGHNKNEFRVIGDNDLPRGPTIWFKKKCEQISNMSDSSDEQLVAAVELAITRTHMSLFGYDPPSGKAFTRLGAAIPATFPTLHILESIDPALDPCPGVVDEVNEAMRAISLHDRPSKYLIKNSSNQAFKEAWHEFDDFLEKIILERILESENDVECRNLQAWYGRYLYRLQALTMGTPAFSHVITKLAGNWRDAKNNYGLEQDIGSGLYALINASTSTGLGHGQPKVLLPYLSPKVETSHSKSNDAIIALELPANLKFIPRVEGDHVILEVMNHEIKITEVALDFELCREALLYADKIGFTEKSHNAAPRIERIRAALLSENVLSALSHTPGMKPRAVAIKGDQKVELH